MKNQLKTASGNHGFLTRWRLVGGVFFSFSERSSQSCSCLSDLEKTVTWQLSLVTPWSPTVHQISQRGYYTEAFEYRFAPLGRQLSVSKNLVTTEILKIFETCHRLQSLSLNNSRFHSIGPWLERRVDQVETLIFLDLRNASGFAAGIEDILQKAYNLKYLGK